MAKLTPSLFQVSFCVCGCKGNWKKTLEFSQLGWHIWQFSKEARQVSLKEMCQYVDENRADESSYEKTEQLSLNEAGSVAPEEDIWLKLH